VRVLYFGTYEREYPRNAQVISCLRGAGVEVIEHHVRVWGGQEHKFGLRLGSAARLARAELRLLRRPKIEFDVLIVGYPGHLDMRAARRVAQGRPIVFNPLVSLEDTIVGDRGLTGPSSAKARAIRRIDHSAFRGSDLVVADTRAHARFFAERFELRDDKLAVCYVGAEDRLFTPGPQSSEPFHALFVGKLIPLHGLETILDAAALCPEIEFRVVGTGQLESALASLPANVTWIRWVEYERLADVYRSAGCALGIFGTSDKAARVIPNKAFQALATAAPLVTADTPAARELLVDEQNALLVPPGDADALAVAVRRLADNAELRGSIGVAGRGTYERSASEPVLGARWRELLENVAEPEG
jgi:glycosyltransferase involved in cell wall biosynthesis